MTATTTANAGTDTLKTTRFKRRGTSLIWAMVALPPLIGICSFAVDIGRAQVVKTELRRAADAAARYAATGLSGGIATVRARAIDAADDNTADGTPVVLNAADVEQGNWSTANRTFAPNGAPLNAVRVTARRSGANAVPTILARVFGKTSIDVAASATVLYVAPSANTGFVGLNSITVNNFAFVGSYNSTTTSNPTQGGSTHNAAMGSNGTVTSTNNSVIDGNVVLGPVGSVVGTPQTGQTVRLTTPIATPADPPWNPGSNPYGIPTSFATANNVSATLPGGTYWFSGFSLGNNSHITFSGPATVYVNGNVTIGNNVSVTAYQSRPANLQFHQIGSNRTWNVNQGITLTGRISSPGGTLTGQNNFTLRGTALFRTINLQSNVNVFVDDAITGGGGSVIGSISTVK